MSNDDSFAWGFTVGLILTAILIFGAFDIVNQGEKCRDRGFNTIVVEDRANTDLGYSYCARGFSENEIREIREPDWVKQHCNLDGICIDEEGEIISRPLEEE